MFYYTQRNRDKESDITHVKESLAVGGYLKYETPWLNDMFQAGFAGYGSAPVVPHLNLSSKGGTQLLTSQNEGIAALGETFFKGKYAKTVATVFRQRIDTPMVNSNDSRMIPQVFEAYSLESKDVEDLTLQVAWIDKVKLRDSEIFKYMSNVSNNAALDNTRRGMFMFGGDWSPEGVKGRAWYYNIPDYLQMTFLEAGSEVAISDTLSLHWLVQGLDQRSAGKQDGGSFNVGEFGVLGGVTWHGVKFDVGGTVVDNTTDVNNRWGNYPFFNNMMAYANNRAGEKTLYLGAAYDFSRIGWTGFKSSAHASFGTTPDSGPNASTDQNEFDVKFNYAFDGKLKGLSILNYWSYQKTKSPAGKDDGMQVRLRFQYDFQLL